MIKVLSLFIEESQTKNHPNCSGWFFKNLLIASAVAFRSAGALFPVSTAAIAAASAIASFFLVVFHIFKTP